MRSSRAIGRFDLSPEPVRNPERARHDRHKRSAFWRWINHQRDDGEKVAVTDASAAHGFLALNPRLIRGDMFERREQALRIVRKSTSNGFGVAITLSTDPSLLLSLRIVVADGLTDTFTKLIAAFVSFTAPAASSALENAAFGRTISLSELAGIMCSCRETSFEPLRADENFPGAERDAFRLPQPRRAPRRP